MAETGTWFGNGLKAAFNKQVDWDSDTIKISLHTSAYTPDQAHEYFDDVTNEVVGSGYTAGGVALANCSIAFDPVTKVLKLDADDVVIAGNAITARYAIIRDAQTNVAGTSPLLGYVDFGANKICRNGSFRITWASAGVLIQQVR